VGVSGNNTPRRADSVTSQGHSSSGDAAGGSLAGQSAVVWASALPGIVSKFRAAIQAEFPQLYAWFDDASLHITVRAIIV
jgi:hypothetical protein